MISRAHFGPIPIARAEISIDEPNVRWVREHGTLHIPDVRAENEFPMVTFRPPTFALSCPFPFVSKAISLAC